MATKLQLYNGALIMLGSRTLSSLSENRESRRVLDNIYDEDGIKTCLEQGLWNFAMKTVKAEYSPSVTPDFGLQYAFDKPSDWCRTAAVCTDEYFGNPLLSYRDEAGYWFADLDTIYVQYVSDDESYGKDLSLWPQNFLKYVQTYFAYEACNRITGSKADSQELERKTRDRLIIAKGTDAMDEPTKFPPNGSWVRARSTGTRERGKKGSLYG